MNVNKLTIATATSDSPESVAGANEGWRRAGSTPTRVPRKG